MNLDGILPSATIMVVSVTGSTTNGQPLSVRGLAPTCAPHVCDDVFCTFFTFLSAVVLTLLSFRATPSQHHRRRTSRRLSRAATGRWSWTVRSVTWRNEVQHPGTPSTGLQRVLIIVSLRCLCSSPRTTHQPLADAKRRILTFVESRMEKIAPNLSAVVGTGPAANMMGAAGGLTALSRMPSCNVQVLGAKRKALSGMSAAVAARGGDLHAGYCFAAELVQQTPPGYRQRAAKLVAAKCTLMARMDAYGEDPAGCATHAANPTLEAQP